MAKRLRFVISVFAGVMLCTTGFAVLGNTYMPSASSVRPDPVSASVQLSADPVPNEWTLSPSIIPWTYGNFSAAQNVFIARPSALDDGESVHFSIKYENGDGITIPIEKEDGAFDNVELTDFAVMRSGHPTYGECYTVDTAANESIVAALNKLDVGAYYLSAWVEGTDTHAAIAETSVMFNIDTANNRWVEVPNIIRWSYGSYDRDVNRITSKALYVGDQYDIHYAIARGEEGEDVVEGLEDFGSTEDGVVNQQVAAVLGTLGFGKYYLVTTVDTPENYNELPRQITEFNILRGENVWVEPPQVTTWNVGEFDSETNTPTMKPKFGESSLRIVITDINDPEEVFYDTANGVDGLYDMMAGSYFLTATVEGTADYTGLEYSCILRIGDSVNIVVKGGGIPWWGVLLIVLGSLAVAVLVFVILHANGVFQLISSKMMASWRAKADIDATIAAVRAGKITAYAQHTMLQLEAEARQKDALAIAHDEHQQFLLEEAKKKEERRARMRAAALERAARTPDEKATALEEKAAKYKARADKIRQSIADAENPDKQQPKKKSRKKKAEQPAEQPVTENSVTEQPTEQPVIEQPATEKSAEKPVEQPKQEPVEEVKAGQPTEQPAETPVEQPAEEQPVQPKKRSRKKKAEQPAEEVTPQEEAAATEAVSEPEPEPEQQEEQKQEPVEQEPAEEDKAEEPPTEPTEEKPEPTAEETQEPKDEDVKAEEKQEPTEEKREEETAEENKNEAEDAVDEPLDEPFEEPVEEAEDDEAKEQEEPQEQNEKNIPKSNLREKPRVRGRDKRSKALAEAEALERKARIAEQRAASLRVTAEVVRDMAAKQMDEINDPTGSDNTDN